MEELGVGLAVLEGVSGPLPEGAWCSAGGIKPGPQAASFQHADTLSPLGVEWSVMMSAALCFAFLPWVQLEL